MNYDNDFGDSDQEDEPDAYLARVKAEAQERDGDENQDSEEESTDEDFNPNQVIFQLFYSYYIKSNYFIFLLLR